MEGDLINDLVRQFSCTQQGVKARTTGKNCERTNDFHYCTEEGRVLTPVPLPRLAACLGHFYHAVKFLSGIFVLETRIGREPPSTQELLCVKSNWSGQCK